MGVLSFLADILFVGHSLIGPDLPPLVGSALRQMEGPTAVEAQIINGAPLSYNWANSAAAEGVDARARLATRPADVLILTEAQPFAGHVQWSDTLGSTVNFIRAAQEGNPDVRVFVYETWPSLKSGSGDPVEGDPDAALPWRDRVASDLALWEGIVSAAAAETGADVALIPAGQAMAALQDAIGAGEIPEISDLSQMFNDDIHPNGKGFYFVAMVQAAMIAGESPEGLPAKLTRSWTSRDARLTEDQAKALQRVAWRAVQNFKPSKGTLLPNLGTATPAADVSAPQTEPQAQPALEAAPLPDELNFPPITNPNLMLGLAGVNDWSVQQPFLNLMKTARPWIGHFPGQFGGWGHDDLAARGLLDAQGWPTKVPPELRAIDTLILTDLPPDAGGVTARYVATYKGKGTLAIEGRAKVIAQTDGQILFDYVPGDGAVFLSIKAIDAQDPLRDIVVVREDRASALAAGAIFNPDWLARIKGVQGIRFMDWMLTNDSTVATLADRPLPTDYTWARKGVPMETLIALANTLQADPWFTLPHMADDTLVRALAVLVHDGLDAKLTASVEYSNEVWNWQFAQARWAEEQGLKRWGKDQAWVQFYALRASEVADIWAEVFADAPDRLQRVIAMQTGYLGLEAQILDAPLVVAEGRPAPATHFDAYAVTGYFSGLLGTEGKVALMEGWLAQSAEAAANTDDPEAHRFDLANSLAAQELRDGSLSGDAGNSLDDLLSEVLPYHAAIAADRGLRLVMYEGGSHVVGIGPVVENEKLTEFMTQLNFSPEMGALYVEVMASWQMLTDAPFNAFVDVYRPNKWGSWGALRHLGDDNPRWQALAKGCLEC